MALADIRKSCKGTADMLAQHCDRLDPRGSLLRTQHLAISALTDLCHGQGNSFIKELTCAVHVAQNIGMHLGKSAEMDGMDELEKEMRRRTLCSLFVWDRCVY